MNSEIALEEWYLNIKHQIGESTANINLFLFGILFDILTESKGGQKKDGHRKYIK